MVEEIDGIKYVRKPGYFAVETNNIAVDGYNKATVTRLDDEGVEHTVNVMNYQDLDDVENMLAPLRFPYTPPTYN